VNRNLVSGIIGVVLGSIWTLQGLMSGGGTPGASSAYESGRSTAAIFGVVFLVAGLYYLGKGLLERSKN
jgi:hypothetical protein